MNDDTDKLPVKELYFSPSKTKTMNQIEGQSTSSINIFRASNVPYVSMVGIKSKFKENSQVCPDNCDFISASEIDLQI